MTNDWGLIAFAYFAFGVFMLAPIWRMGRHELRKIANHQLRLLVWMTLGLVWPVTFGLVTLGFIVVILVDIARDVTRD